MAKVIKAVEITEITAKMEAFAKENHVPIINENGRKVFIEMIKKFQPKRVLEIGTAIGYSAILTALYSKSLEQIVSLELSAQRAAVAQGFIDDSPYSDKIEIILGDAAEILLRLNDDEANIAKFDMVFIDAAKGQYPDYLHKVLPLLSDNGVIIADNVLFRGYVRSEEKPPRRYKTIVKRLREYIDLVSDEDKFNTTIYENGDGLAVSQKV